MKVLILGGAGLTGRRAVELALGRGYEVYATYRNTPPPPDLQANWLKADVDNLETIKKLLDETEPDAVIDLHAYNKVDDCEDIGREQCWKSNAVSPGLWAKECSKRGIKYVWVSTDFVFDGESPPYSEEDVPRPLSQYAVSKLVGEQRVLLEGGIVLRTAVVYDVPEGKFVGWVLNNLKEGRKVPAFVDQWNNPTWAKDLAEACLLSAEKLDGPALLHAAGRKCMSRYEFAKVIAKAFGYDDNLVEPACSCRLHQKARRPFKACLKVERIWKVLGFVPRAPEEVFSEIF